MDTFSHGENKALWRKPMRNLIIAIMLILFSCHPAPAEDQWNMWLMQKAIRCLPAYEAMEIMELGNTTPLLTGVAEVLTKDGNTIPLISVYFADVDSGRWAVVELNHAYNEACIIDMGGELDFSPNTQEIYKWFNYIPGELN